VRHEKSGGVVPQGHRSYPIYGYQGFFCILLYPALCITLLVFDVLLLFVLLEATRVNEEEVIHPPFPSRLEKIEAVESASGSPVLLLH